MGDVGAILRDERERLGIGIDQIEAETHIRAKYLLALEEDRFDVLPGPAYVRAFLRGYAERLGLDPQQLMAELNTRPGMIEEVMIAPRQVASVPMLGRRTRVGAWWAVFVVPAVIVAAVLVLYVR